MKEFFIGLLDWIYKKKCYFCRSSKESVKMCSKCFDELDYLPVEINRRVSGKDIYCAGVYNKNLQKLIRGLKYHGQTDLAYYLAKFMFQYWQRLNLEGEYEIVPVPIFARRKKKRRYNHMELAAVELAKLTDFNVNTNLIKRIKDTKPQYNLKKHERVENLSGAFEVDKSFYNGGKILIIDDICTTGSTFDEMIKAFNRAGIYDITCFAATTPFNN